MIISRGRSTNDAKILEYNGIVPDNDFKDMTLYNVPDSPDLFWHCQVTGVTPAFTFLQGRSKLSQTTSISPVS